MELKQISKENGGISILRGKKVQEKLNRLTQDYRLSENEIKAELEKGNRFQTVSFIYQIH